MKLSYFVPRGLTVLAVAAVVAAQTGSVLAQYAQYGNAYQGGYPSYQPRQAQAYGPQYAQGGSQFMPGPRPAQPQSMAQSQYSAQPQYATQPRMAQPRMAQPQYVAMAQSPVTGNLPAISQPMEPVSPGPMQQQSMAQPDYSQQQAPMDYSQGGYESYSAGNGAGGSCANGAGYSCDGYGNYNQPSYGCCDTSCCGPRRHWFGGVYGLLMDRVPCGNGNLVYQTNVDGTGHYPTYDEVAMSYADLDNGVQGGAEVRFGATLACCGGGCGYGGGCSDPCGGCSSGCGGGCGALGWEAAYWALAEDTTYATVVDADTYGNDGNVTYGMKNFNRLRHNNGGGWRPVNQYFSYGIPSSDYWSAYGNIGPQVRQITARDSFSMQNAELNLVCIPLAGGGCSSAAGGCCDSGGGCDSCGGGSCGTGGCCGRGHCGGGCGSYCYCGPRCQCSTFLGTRYVRFDEDFMLRSDYDMYDYSGAPVYAGNSGYLAYNVETENQLVGFQVGGNGCYRMGCCGRFALQCSSNAGIYNNFTQVNSWFSQSAGQTYDDGTNTLYNVTTQDSNVAFLGELRLGASYQCTCNCRLYGGYRVFGATGIALATYQDISNTDSAYINCSGSVFLHGLQSGIEFMY